MSVRSVRRTLVTVSIHKPSSVAEDKNRLTSSCEAQAQAALLVVGLSLVGACVACISNNGPSPEFYCGHTPAPLAPLAFRAIRVADARSDKHLGS